MADPQRGTDAPEPMPVVFIVDDDESVRRGLSSILRSVGFSVRLFGSADEFLKGPSISTPSCLLLDVRLPGMSGLALQAQLPKTNMNMPIVMISGHGDVPMSVRALKAGAVDFLVKPFRDQDVIDAVSHAVEADRGQRERNRAVRDLLALYATLTPREREIFENVSKGWPNKRIATEMGLKEITVKIHRGQVMRKMAAQSIADLVRMAEAVKAHAR